MKEFLNFIYMEKQKFIFVYNPKVACTNWKCILRYLNGQKEDYLSAKIAHNKPLSGLTFLSELEAPREVLRSQSIKKYSFVRNPYSRVLSAYLNKVEPYAEGVRGENDDNSYFYQVFQHVNNHRLNNLPEKKRVDFYCFLHWIKNVDDAHTRNEHWLAQSLLLRIDEVEYDFIGKFESIENDATHLLQEMKCDVEFPSQSKVHFAPTNANEKLKKYFGENEISLVKQIYAQGFDSFGYESGRVG